MSEIKNAVIDDLNAMNDNLIPDIPIEVLYKYLLKDYRRQKQHNLQLEKQNESLLKRNNYLETEYAIMKNRLTKLTEKQIEYSKEFKELHQALSCRNNTISQLRTENTKLKGERDTDYAAQVDKTGRLLSFSLSKKRTIFVPIIFATMDLLQFLPDNNQSWIKPCADSIGWEKLVSYYDKVSLMLSDMKPGDTFRVLEKVSPDNYDLFIKCVYTILCEFSSYGIYSYYIEEQGTIILRR